MWLVTVADGESVASCGSRVTASVPWATTSVCARAEADRAPAASSVTVRRRLFLSMCTPLVTAGHQIQDWMQYGPPTGPVPVRQLADSSLWTSWYGRQRLRSTDGHVSSWDGQVNNARSRGLPALFWRFPLVMAEREGFEPSMQETHIHAFQACSLNHSDTSPRAALKGFGGKGKSTSRCRPGSTSCRRRPGRAGHACKRWEQPVRSCVTVFKDRVRNLATPEPVQVFLASYPTSVVFKAGTCHKTMQGFGNLQEQLESREDLMVGLIRVVEWRPASNLVSELTGIRHESPQVILFRDRKSVV